MTRDFIARWKLALLYASPQIKICGGPNTKLPVGSLSFSSFIFHLSFFISLSHP